MSKRPNTELPDGPPRKVPVPSQSNIEFTILKQKLKSIEAQNNDRGNKLAVKHQELMATKKQMDDMQKEHVMQIKKLNDLLSFQNEEVRANQFKESVNTTSNLNSHRSSRPHHPSSSRILNNVANVPPPKLKEEEEREMRPKALVTNLLIRRLSANSTRKNEPDPLAKYKIEQDTDLPCNLNRDEMWKRFETVKNDLKAHPTHNVTFEDFKIPSRQEVLSSEIFESNDRSHRASIWTAMHANEERFLYRDPNCPTLQRMHPIEKNMEYNSAYAENKNNFEKLEANSYQVPQWFSNFYV